MGKNPAAETQSGSQMKNKKGLVCWGCGSFTTFYGWTA